ncbi:unnamed protein product [Prunus armeniaca]
MVRDATKLKQAVELMVSIIFRKLGADASGEHFNSRISAFDTILIFWKARGKMLKNIFTLDNNSSPVTLTYAVWTNLCACLGESSLSFLSVVIPSLIKKATGSVRIEVDENPGLVSKTDNEKKNKKK